MRAPAHTCAVRKKRNRCPTCKRNCGATAEAFSTRLVVNCSALAEAFERLRSGRAWTAPRRAGCLTGCPVGHLWTAPTVPPPIRQRVALINALL